MQSAVGGTRHSHQNPVTPYSGAIFGEPGSARGPSSWLAMRLRRDAASFAEDTSFRFLCPVMDARRVPPRLATMVSWRPERVPRVIFADDA